MSMRRGEDRPGEAEFREVRFRKFRHAVLPALDDYERQTGQRPAMFIVDKIVALRLLADVPSRPVVRGGMPYELYGTIDGTEIVRSRFEGHG